MSENPRTPRSAGLGPASYLSWSCEQVALVLTTLAAKSDPNSVQNVSAKLHLFDMQSQAQDARIAVQECRPDYPDFSLAPAGSQIAEQMEGLSKTLNRAKKDLDDFLIGDFEAHVGGAIKLERLFSVDAVEIVEQLSDDLEALSPTLFSVVEACDAFGLTWTRIRDKARNDSLARETGGQPKRTYTDVLHQYWRHEAYEMKPEFLSLTPPITPDSMDIWSIPAVDKEMQQFGRDWINKLTGRTGSDNEQKEAAYYRMNKLVRQVVKGLKPALADTGAKPAIGKDHGRFNPDEMDACNTDFGSMSLGPGSATQIGQQKSNIPTDIASRWSNIIDKLEFNTHDKYLRVFVFGPVKHGKTSIINSLIGKVLLHTEILPATAWPLVVRHVVGKTRPQLRVDPKHFEPFLTFIRTQKFSARWTEDAPRKRGRSKLGAASTTKRMQKFLPTVQDLKALEDTGFKINALYDDPAELRKTLVNINNLMRCCYILASDTTPFPTLKNMEWPTLEVEFTAWGSNPVKLEILDLPGLGEKDTKMPENIMDHALRGGVDGSLLAVLRSTWAQDSTTQLIKIQSIRGSDEPPLAAFGTHSDVDGMVDSLVIRQGMAESIWNDEQVANRVSLCAPGLYASAVSALLRSFDQETLVPELSSGKVVEDPTGELKDLRDYWYSLPCAVAVHKILHADFPECSDGYLAHDRQGWKKKLDDLIDSCKQQIFVEHIQKYVLDDGAERRQLYALLQARGDLRKLIATQSDLVATALDTCSGDYNDTNTRFNELQSEGKEVLKSWTKSGHLQIKDMEKALETEAAELLKQAREIVDDEVGKRIPETGRVVSNQSAALRIVTDIGEGIRDRLSDLAAQYISDIRVVAENAWAARVKSLAIKLRGLSTRFPSELMDSLDADATDPSQAVRQATTNRIAQLTGDQARAGQHYDETIKKPWLTHQTAMAKLADLDVDLDLTAAEEIVVQSLNAMGYVFRAPVSADAIKPPLVNDENWPSLTGEYEATLPRKEAEDAFRKAVIDPWFKYLRADSRDSVVGAMKVASKIAGGQLKAIVDPESEDGATLGAGDAKFLNPKSLNAMVIQQARCCLLYGAIDEICKKWAADFSTILPKACRPLDGDTRGFVANTEEDFGVVDI